MAGLNSCRYTSSSGSPRVPRSWIMFRIVSAVRISRNRSDSENLSLEIPSSPVVPYGHGYASLIATGPLGTNATCSTSLYWHAGGTGGRLRGPGALVRGSGPHLTGTASQELAEFFTPSINRSTAVATSTSPTRSASSWGATGSSGPYAYPDPCGRGR